MNIKITYDWLLEYLETDADPYEMQKFLSLCGPSIETVDKVGDSAKGGLTDYVFDIEITSNRVDMASVFGVAQEAQAILPQFGKKATFKKPKLTTPKNPDSELPIEIVDQDHLTNRILAIVLDNVTIGPSPKYIQDRLTHAGIRTLNNVVDVTNYIMLELGHPTHVFDYDRIAGQKMIFRKSKKGEKITSLEDKTYTLTGGDSIIEDGKGRIIDLPGIIGTSNSVVVADTKRVLLFIDNNDPIQMRKSSMKLGIRTVAATYNEKSPDPERAYDTLLRGIELLQKNTGATIASKIIDIYPQKKQESHVKAYLKDIQRVIGIALDEEKVTSILTDLGFKVDRHEDTELAYPDGVHFDVTVPTHRTDDVSIQEDIFEEVARVYGYHNLPNNISPLTYIKQPKHISNLYKVQYRSKYFLKHLGLHEFLNYSMVSGELLTQLDFKLADHLKLANTISQEIEYMRTSLLPSVIKNMRDNQGKIDTLKLFEIAKIYEPRAGDLPNECHRLAIAVNTDFNDLKGIVMALLHELNIDDVTIQDGKHTLMSQAATIRLGNNTIGSLGMLHQKYADTLSLSQAIHIAEIDFEPVIQNYQVMHQYHAPLQFAVVKLDLTLIKKLPYQKMVDISHENSKLLQNVEYVSSFENKISLRFYFSSETKNITEKEALLELEQIRTALNS